MNDKSHDKEFLNRKSVRLQEYDYTKGGNYFVTVCAAGRRASFGRIEDGSIVLSRIGEIIQECWLGIPEHFPTVLLDEYVVMPNHVHGILFLNEEEAGTACRAPTRERFGEKGIVSNDEVEASNANVKTGTACRAPTMEGFGRPVVESVPTIMRSFKSAVTRKVHEKGLVIHESFWQRGYYEHVIRNEIELDNIRAYIIGNPAQWEFDQENPRYL